MDGALLFAILIAGAVTVVLVLGLRAAKKAGIERNAQLQAMAARLGLNYVEQPPAVQFLPPSAAVSGVFAGRHARLHAFSRGSGKNRTQWVAARMRCNNPATLRLSMRSQGPAIFERIAGAFGYKDFVLGDASFDPLLVVSGSDEAFIKAALIPEIRGRIVAFWPKASGSRITVEDGEAVYEEQGTLSSARCRKHLEKAFPVLADVAALAEVHAAGGA